MPANDKLTEYGPGPWVDEPDHLQWEAHGLPCMIHRGPLGALCGYVAVPPGPPLHGKHYDDEAVAVDVHGGLTYARECQGELCHVPQPGEPDDVWWFGFDCAHFGDLLPFTMTLDILLGEGGPRMRTIAESLRRHKSYRDIAYVREQTEELAQQLAAAATP